MSDPDITLECIAQVKQPAEVHAVIQWLLLLLKHCCLILKELQC